MAYLKGPVRILDAEEVAVRDHGPDGLALGHPSGGRRLMGNHVHRLDRPVSEADDGRVTYGCSAVHACSKTEIRRAQEPSPYAVARAKRRLAARERRWRDRTHA